MAENNTQSVLEMSDDEFLANETSIMNSDSKEDTPQESKSSEPEITESDKEDTSSNSSEEPKQEKEEEKEEEKIDYEAFYKEVTAPFTADGKEISVKNSKDIISLMQKGTDYTRKTQQLAPNRKIIEFLQQQKLLDANKLELLADIANGNKAAIKKLIKEKNIDVLDLEDYADDEESSKEYTPQAKMPSDATVLLNDTVADIAKKANGLDMLNEINKAYDPQSINFIEQNPLFLNELYSHKASGLYDKIKAELERRIALNQLNPNTPFLGNYAIIYKEITNNGTKAVVTQPYINNGLSPSVNKQINNQVKGAKSTSSRGITNTTNSKKHVNYLEMSDEDFMKQFG